MFEKECSNAGSGMIMDENGCDRISLRVDSEVLCGFKMLDSEVPALQPLLTTCHEESVAHRSSIFDVRPGFSLFSQLVSRVKGFEDVAQAMVLRFQKGGPTAIFDIYQLFFQFQMLASLFCTALWMRQDGISSVGCGCNRYWP